MDKSWNMKILKSKKAQGNDTILLISVFVFFFLLGVILPYISAAFSTPYIDNPDINTNQDYENPITHPIGFYDVFFSVLTVLFWSFNVNFWINLLLIEPFRVFAYILIFRAIRGI